MKKTPWDMNGVKKQHGFHLTCILLKVILAPFSCFHSSCPRCFQIYCLGDSHNFSVLTRIRYSIECLKRWFLKLRLYCSPIWILVIFCLRWFSLKMIFSTDFNSLAVIVSFLESSITAVACTLISLSIWTGWFELGDTCPAEDSGTVDANIPSTEAILGCCCSIVATESSAAVSAATDCTCLAAGSAETGEGGDEEEAGAASKGGGDDGVLAGTANNGEETGGPVTGSAGWERSTSAVSADALACLYEAARARSFWIRLGLFFLICIFHWSLWYKVLRSWRA